MLTHNQTVKSLQLINHVVSIYGIYYAVAFDAWSWLILSLVLWYTIYGPIGINVGFHRLISHRSYKTNKYIEYALALMGSMCTVGSPMAWCAIHRQHHKKTDAEGDPHSPHRIGNFKAWFGLWEKPNLNPRLVKDLIHNKFYVFLHNHYLKIILSFVALLAVIDPLLVVFAYAIPASLTFHSCSAGVVLTHYYGYKTHDLPDESRNSWISHILAGGEGWHNNHHKSPGNWNTQEKWWEIDPPAWIIRLIKQ
jgi:fatty-acid desaturase